MPRSFLVKKAPPLPTTSSSESSWGDVQSDVTSTQCEPTSSQRQRPTTNWPYDADNGNGDNVTVTSRITAAEGDHSIGSGSDHVTSRWLLVSKRPDLCYWLENNVANLPVADDVRMGKDDVTVFCVRSPAEQQQRSALSTLYVGSPGLSSVPTSMTKSQRNGPAAPWRPFTVHDEYKESRKPPVSATNSGLYRPLSVVSSVDNVDYTVQRQSSVATPQWTPFHQHRPPHAVLPDGLYSYLMTTMQAAHHHHKSLGQQPDNETRLEVLAPSSSSVSTPPPQCGNRVLSTFQYELAPGQRHQSSCPSQSSSPPQSASTGSSPPATRSPSPLLSCPHCDKTYTSSGALKMHVRTHTLPCRCPSCGKAFSRPWLLQGHIRTHTGERPFTCTVCGRAFADRSNLRAHGQTHAVAKRYQCTACRRSFSRLSLLLRHERHSTSGCCRDRQRDLELDSTRPADVR